MRTTLFACAATTAAVISSAAAAHGSLTIPTLPSPSSFTTTIDNPWFPLRPGTVFVYRGEKDGKRGRDVMTVTRSRADILGIHATVVLDRLYLAGRLAERTTDWYAEDKSGNVWYLGERTATLDPAGRIISTDGSSRAGVHGARPGIYMPAHPAPGQTGRQEYYPGHAEDQFKVVSLHARVTSPAASSTDALLTQETTRLEPGTLDHKVYVRGVGTVIERTIKGGSERFTLVGIKHV